ncbi:hypothetical protein ABGB17_31040 [Sphaerisporangium sp. B11E5]|uniref:hypothetical protein n=1 Tax=Sphaerisporangium sp. B11E5 TaxID=3153563 RepID=UPI00325E8089
MRTSIRRPAAALGLAALTALAVVGAEAPATAGTYLETQYVVCPSYDNGTYYDDYDNYPGDWQSQTGYRAYARCMKKSANSPASTVRLVTECEWGFTYHGAPTKITDTYGTWLGASPSENTAGCLFGVKSYKVEHVSVP